MFENVHRFLHEDIQGAVLRVMEDEVLAADEFLPEGRKLAAPQEYPFAYTCCYLQHRGHNILIDVGFDADTVPGALESIDIAPEEIDLVLLTHADRDHIQGALRPDGSFTYPNAQHVIGRELWENLRRPETLAALDDERRPFYRKLVRAFDDILHLCDDESEVTEGIVFLPCPGHRIGHAAYELATAGAPLIHSGDSFFHPLFVEHPDWPNLHDSVPDQAAASRIRLAERAAARSALVLGSHLAFPGIGRIESIDGAFRWANVS